MVLLPLFSAEFELFARAGFKAVDELDLAWSCCLRLLLELLLVVLLELARLSRVSLALVFKWILVFSGIGGGTSIRFWARDMLRLFPAGGFSLLLLAIFALLAAAALLAPRP